MRIQIRLTATAQAHARRHALAARLDRLELGAEVQQGDLVALPAPGHDALFIVRSRCWQVDAHGDVRLLIELDHPPRPDGLR